MGEVNLADDPRLHRKGVNITLRIASQSFEEHATNAQFCVFPWIELTQKCVRALIEERSNFDCSWAASPLTN